MGLIDAVMQPVRPLIFIVAGLMFGFVSTAELLLAMDFSTLLSPSAFRKYWFARLWRFIGPLSYAMGKDNVAPLVAQAKGRVLDIGTGTGHFLRYYDKEQVTKIYAVETNRGQHVGLLQAAQEAGLSDRLEALDQPLELLRDHSDLQHGTIDTIVTIQVLCSVDDQDRLIKELYNYLKPGGQWIVYEHVKTSSKGVLGEILARYQELLDVVWPRLFDGCSVCHDTKRALESAGKWSSVSLRVPEGEPSTSVIPHIAGILHKA